MSETDPAAGVLARAQARVEDLKLAHVAEWKARTGGLAVGLLPVYSPRPLLEAIGCLPVGIFGGGDAVDIIRGDSYFQSYICHLPRSVIELGLNGSLDALDGVLFPSICDVIRNLSGMWQMLFPDKYASYLDLPQNFDPALGGRFYAMELRRVAADLEARGARPLDDDALRAAIEAENGRRALIARLDALRSAEPWRVPASEAYLVVRAGSSMTADDHCKLLGEYLDAVAARDGRPYDNVRVVVTGAFCEQPPVALIRALERAGCDIVADDFQLGLRTISGALDVPDGADPVDALAGAYLTQGEAAAFRYIDDGVKGEALIEQVEQQRADGVIFAAASFCDPALLDRPMLEAALDREGIPHTGFKYSEDTGQFQVIREQAGAFSDAVKLWGVNAPPAI